MASISKPSSASLGFLLLGGWTGVKSASVGSVCAVLVTFASLTTYDILQNGIETIEFSRAGFESFFSGAAFLLAAGILLSTIPGFIGGVLLAWLLKREHSITSDSSPRKTNLGAWVGASAGVVLSLLVVVPADLVGRAAHSGIGYSLLNSLPMYMFYAIQFTAIATMAGIWSDRELRKELARAGAAI